ncbi:MAG: LysR substrate-binding domain-containing protein [Pseudomonadota bacterium]
MRDKVDLRRLRYFLSVVEHESFSRAAEALGISQPPLSQQIAKLEDEIGTRLIERSRTIFALTHAGAVLVSEAQRTIRQADRAFEATRAAAKGEMGRLCIGFTDDNFGGEIFDAIAKFHAQFPKARIYSTVADSRSLTKLVEDQQLDLAIVTQSSRSADGETLKSSKLPPIELVAIFPHTHTLAKEKSIRLQQLSAEKFIFIPTVEWTGLGAQAGRLFDQAGFTPDVTHETFSTETIISLVSAGVGVSLVTRNIAELHAPRIAIASLRGGAQISRAAIQHKDNNSVLAKNYLQLMLCG